MCKTWQMPPPAAVTPPMPRPWAQCPPTALAGVQGVMTDIDDTLTDHGELGSAATAALQRLAAARVPVIAIARL